MARFTKRVTDEQVARARQRMSEGATLRAAAAEIPCAASTLSYRIGKAEQAEAADREIGDTRVLEAHESHTGAEGAPDDKVGGPLEVLRDALRAAKRDGQPDWATRISAARTLATLRPQELEPRDPKLIPAQITVFDLEPGAYPVLHHPRAVEGGADIVPEETLPANDVRPDDNPHSSGPCFYYYKEPGSDETGTLIGSWSPAGSEDPTDPKAVVTISFATTEDSDTAERWRAELTAGQLPRNTETE